MNVGIKRVLKLTPVKLPFNNSCLEHGSSSYAVSGFRVESHNMDSHVKKTLPPSLSSFPGEAQIRYYIKATVVRPQFYKENMRAVRISLVLKCVSLCHGTES